MNNLFKGVIFWLTCLLAVIVIFGTLPLMVHLGWFGVLAILCLIIYSWYKCDGYDNFIKYTGLYFFIDLVGENMFED